MMRSGFTIQEFCENTKVARELAVVGQYEDAAIYYEGAITFMNHFINTLNDHSNKKLRYQKVLHEVKVEYELLKDAREMLRTIGLHFDSPIKAQSSVLDDDPDDMSSDMWTTDDPNVWPPNLADKDKWPSPTTVDHWYILLTQLTAKTKT